jgi:hypothetical protein
MTHSNAQLLRDAYQGFGHGEIRPLLGMLSEDITFALDLGPLEGTIPARTRCRNSSPR